MSSSSYSSTMLSHCQPKGERSERRQQGKPLVSTSREEDKDIHPTFHLGSPIIPLVSKNWLPTPIAHRKLEGATDV